MSNFSWSAYALDTSPKNGTQQVRLQDTPIRILGVPTAPTYSFLRTELLKPTTSVVPPIPSVTAMATAQMVPRPYWVFIAIAAAFLLAGVGLSSVVVAGSGLALFATIGAALWEIRKRLST